MSIAQISPNSVLATPTEVNPKIKADQASAVAQYDQTAKKSLQSIKTDTVTISQEAVHKLASDNESAAMRTKENGTEKTEEKEKRN